MTQYPQLPDDHIDAATPLTVAYVERRPALGRHFSVERVFDAVSAHPPPGITIQRVMMPRSGIGLLTLLRNARAARAVRADVIHVTGDVHYVLPFVRRRAVRVLTIHDLASLNRTSGVRNRLIRWLWYTWPLAAADAVTVVSDETRRQLIAEFAAAAHKVRVVGNPVTAPFADVRPRLPRESRDPSASLVLAVGAGANKNLARTAEAVNRVGASLRVIGRLDRATVKRLGEIGVVYEAVHSLTDDELLAEYERADVLAFPSLHEGFGLPILEAQAVGLPVVTSKGLPMSAVAADGALLVDPQDPLEIAAAIEAIATDRALRDRLRAAGLDNVRRYSPQEIAEDYARIYRGLRRPPGQRLTGKTVGRER